MRRIVVLLLIVVGCSPSKEEKLHLESVENHDLAIKISEHVGDKIHLISVYSGRVEEPLRSLLLDSIRVLSQDFEYWESTVVEVPGHEHEHNHHDHDHAGHDHDHGSGDNLTPEMMLGVQKDLRDRIVRLNVRAQKILNTLEEDIKK